MKKWRCSICGYVFEGEMPPDACPVCGGEYKDFVLVENQQPVKRAGKSWRCTVCDYVHIGDCPPEFCPLCGVGASLFVLLEAVAEPRAANTLTRTKVMPDQSSLEKIGYGLYIVTSCKETAVNGQCANTVFQLTNEPPRIAICLNKNNLTHEYIVYSNTFAVSVLSVNQLEAVRTFGYRSGRAVDKFAGIQYSKGQTGCPIIPGCIAYIEARVLPDKTADVGTHTLFVADVIGGRVITDEEPLSYAFYRKQKRSGG